MAKVKSVQPESDREAALRKWFAAQELKSVENVEAGARQVITLVTAMLGLLFAVMAVTADPLPRFFYYPTLRWLGVGSVVLFLLALLGALVAVYPFPYRNYGDRPDKQGEAFNNLLRNKTAALTISGILFASGLLCLGIILVSALLLSKPAAMP